jgi:trehalose monomycolate/heme transporter
MAGGVARTTVEPPTRQEPRPSEPLTEPIPVVAPTGSGPIRATRQAKEDERRSATGKPAQAPIVEQQPQPTWRPQTAAAPESQVSPPAVSTPPAPPVPAQPPVREPVRSIGNRTPVPDPRSIESWLADLRAPSDKPSAQPQRSEPQRSEVTGNADSPVSSGTSARNGRSSATNGSGTNGSGTNGSSVNSSATNGRQPYGTGSAPGGPDRSAGNDPVRPGDVISGPTPDSSPRTGGIRGYSQSASGTNGHEQDRTPSTPRARYDISTRNAPRNPAPEDEPNRSRSGGATPEPNAPQRSRRAAEPEVSDSTAENDSGKHRGGDGRQALSVSELLARERRQ